MHGRKAWIRTSAKANSMRCCRTPLQHTTAIAPSTTIGMLQAGTLLWQVPYGHSRRFGSDSNAVLDGVLGGWQASFYEQAHSGNR